LASHVTNYKQTQKTGRNINNGMRIENKPQPKPDTYMPELQVQILDEQVATAIFPLLEHGLLVEQAMKIKKI
jgi:hypothetical protein